MIWQYPVSVKSRMKIFVVHYTKKGQDDSNLLCIIEESGAPQASPRYFDLFGEIRRSTFRSRLPRVILLAFIHG